MPGTKQASTYRKKRKRTFHGTQRQDLREEGDQQAPLALGQSTTSCSPAKPNRSSEKISSNCPVLERMANQVITRKKALDLGQESPTGVVKAYGYKVIDTRSLQQVFRDSVICAMCRSPEGKLDL